MRQWGINTPTGLLLVDLKFFKRLKIKEIKKTGDILFISTQKNDSFSILEKDWNEIIKIIRDDKIKSIFETN